GRMEKVLAKTSPSIAVTVSESAGPDMPRDPAHAGLFRDRPVMVVFGNSRWVSDEGLRGRTGQAALDLFSSCLSWLREKSSIGAAARSGRDREVYNLNISEQSRPRLTWLPLALLVLAVVALGCGVWIVRRR